MKSILTIMMVLITLIAMTGIGMAMTDSSNDDEESQILLLYRLGLRFGTEQARIDLGLVDHQLQEFGTWSNHPLFLRGYDITYTKTMNMMG